MDFSSSTEDVIKNAFSSFVGFSDALGLFLFCYFASFMACLQMSCLLVILDSILNFITKLYSSKQQTIFASMLFWLLPAVTLIATYILEKHYSIDNFTTTLYASMLFLFLSKLVLGLVFVGIKNKEV